METASTYCFNKFYIKAIIKEYEPRKLPLYRFMGSIAYPISISTRGKVKPALPFIPALKRV